MTEVLIYREELLTSILCVKIKDEEKYGISLQDLEKVEEEVKNSLLNRGIKALITSYLPREEFGYMHGSVFMYDNVPLEQLIAKFKNLVKNQEVLDLIWNEDFIRASLNQLSLNKKM